MTPLRHSGEGGDRLRAAVIGCGFFAQNHLNAWRSIADVDLVAVCDRARDKAEAAAASFDIPSVYEDAEHMLAQAAPDFVDIVTTSETHRPLAALAAGHGAAVICQKPFADTLADGQAMVDACRQAGVPLMVHENFRWQRPFREAKRLIDDGAVGRPFYGSFAFRHRFDAYRTQPYLAEIERFTIMDVGLHLFDLARFFFGEVAGLHCLTQRLNPAVRGEDSFLVTFRHHGGAVSTCGCSFFSRRHPEPFPQTLAAIEGTDGTIDILEGYRLRLHRHEGVEEIDVEPAVPAWGARPFHAIQDSVAAIQRHWVDCLRAGIPTETSGEDNLKTLRLAMLAYESAERGAALDVA